jgi:Tripartite tricarboxylate transporter TctB family
MQYLIKAPIKAPKDFWTGVIYVAVGAAALWIGAEYQMGTAGRMGSGYFPKVLASILVVLGVISLARSFVTDGGPITAMAIMPFMLILIACTLFGFLLPRLGLGVGLLVLCVVSAAASDRFRFDPKVAVGLLTLIVCCVLVFVKGLGVPIPLLGSWLDPVLGPILPWLR